MDKNYYVYEHRTADTGRTFYVGRGNRRRAWRKDSRNPHWHAVVNKHGYDVFIVQDGLCHGDASLLEVSLIAKYGMDNLCNLTEGGSGSFGFTHSRETRKKMSKAKTGRRRSPFTDETREKMSVAATGRVHTKESLMKMRDAKLGRQLSCETKRKISASNKGKNAGRVFSEETLAKMRDSASQRGDTLTLHHPEEGTVTAKVKDFVKHYGLHSGCLSMLKNGKAKSHKGWTKP